MPQENYHQDTHRAEVDEIIGSAPKAIVRRGTTVIALLVLLLLLGAWLISYPDMVPVPVTLFSSDPPVKVIAPGSGRITEIFVKDSELIQAHAIIGVIENTANTDDMLYLKQQVEVLDSTNNIHQTIAGKKLQVGELQEDYKKLLQLAEQNQTVLQHATVVTQDIHNLIIEIKRQIALWDTRYVIHAPVSGRMMLIKAGQTAPYVSSGEALGMVIPAVFKEEDIWAQLPVTKAGKVKPGQKVLIKLQEYPFMEYGLLQGKIEKITSIPIDSNYFMKITLDHGLRTTRNKLIPQRPGLIGIASIVVSDKNILQRIFESTKRSR
ncbi:multidrug resistance efflux pump [Chitinophaga niastensis]|uniref:Multidrug resistance efflux pump n=1 Tax=Chitinophaga niastensis TaxID=536980 RepID=A0A2P8HVU0_CHINA|nr:HlyD family efflux transporter periplasmic adaptor subunit [Chitinophaga niastensis]PSL50298.1 multidrug resistance efflux pump [Chitinophaga niastensis]